MWLLIAAGESTLPDVPGGLINWIVVTLVGVLVWLVKRLVDNNQEILKAMKEENALVRADHRIDIKAILDDSKANRETYETGFKQIASAITQLTNQVRITGNEQPGNSSRG